MQGSIALFCCIITFTFTSTGGSSHLDIGFFSPVHYEGTCIGPLSAGTNISEVSIRHVLDSINKRQDLLPNITLGLKMLNFCMDDLFFSALQNDQIDIPYNNSQFLSLVNLNIIGTIGLTYKTFPQQGETDTLGGDIHNETARQIGMDQLIENNQQNAQEGAPDFPDIFNMPYGLIQIMEFLDWTYFSLIYSQFYGSMVRTYFMQAMMEAEKSICLSADVQIPSNASEEDLLAAAQKLKEDPRARIVVVFLLKTEQYGFFAAVNHLNLTEHFIFMTNHVFDPAGQLNVGSLLLFQMFKYIQLYKPYLNGLLRMPGFTLPMIWSTVFACGRNETECYNFPRAVNSALHDRGYPHSERYDSIFSLAHAVHSLIEDQCPNAFRNPSEYILTNCITGERLYGYLSNQDFSKSSKYFEIYKYSKIGDDRYDFINVGSWDAALHKISFDLNMLDWSSTHITEGPFQAIPKSVCSMDCPSGYYRRFLEKTCCWDCIRCRTNEVVASNGSYCEECPMFQWPDEPTNSICHKIKAYYLSGSEPSAIALIVLSIIGMVSVVLVALVVFSQRHHRLIRATSIGLSSLILAGIFLSSLSIILFIMKPGRVICLMRWLGFHYGIHLLYAPLVVKTMRIYRIFEAAKYSVKTPILTSSKAQIIIMTVIFCLQVGCDSAWTKLSTLTFFLPLCIVMTCICFD